MRACAYDGRSSTSNDDTGTGTPVLEEDEVGVADAEPAIIPLLAVCKITVVDGLLGYRGRTTTIGVW